MGAGVATAGTMAVLVAVTASAGETYVPEPRPCPSDLVVGCYYFPGHFNPLRWTPMRQCGFPVPILGYYRDGEPEVSDWHIKWAAEHGIDFFAFDWYYDYRHGANSEHNKALDDGFLRARYRNRMQFCLMWCNEGQKERYDEEQMVRLAGVLTERYFRQPNHLRIDGDNVLIVSMPEHFLDSFGTEGTARIFGRMAEICRKAGCGGLFPVAKQQNNQERLKQAGFRAITAYNYPEAGMSDEQRKAARGPYADMVRGYEQIWKEVTGQGVLPYIVPVAPGWDSRPWYGDRALVRTNPSPRLFREMCMGAKQYADPKLHMVLAECWNEFGEGSYVEPTVQYGFGCLDAMRDAFCKDNPHHDDMVPTSVGRAAPVFAEVPVPVEEMAARGSNLLYNPDFEGDWGWVRYSNEPAHMDAPGHRGRRCLRVAAGSGVKTLWMIPMPKDRPIAAAFWYRVPDGATLAVQAALFRSERWLERYAELATLTSTGDQWKLLEKMVTLTDPDATHFDIEFTASGGDCRVDDIVLRIGG
jgi:hypothetical protein